MSMKMTMAEFVGLELCPFCKGEAFYNPEYNGGSNRRMEHASGLPRIRAGGNRGVGEH